MSRLPEIRSRSRRASSPRAAWTAHAFGFEQKHHRFFVAREVLCRTKACQFVASKLNAKMTVVRVRGPGVRVEGAKHGELVVAFFAEGFRGARRRVEALLVAT